MPLTAKELTLWARVNKLYSAFFLWRLSVGFSSCVVGWRYADGICVSALAIPWAKAFRH
jgi:hypothetical protein